MSDERSAETEQTDFPLTREDIARLQSNLGNAAQLDLRRQNLQHVDLSYMDLHGADLQGTDLQWANLRGTNLSGTDLQGANLSEADLDGADLSNARLGETEASRVKLYHTKLSYARLKQLDLRGFNLAELDLSNADLNGTDLREANLRGTNLQGADLSTAQLNGPELSGAILHSSAFPGKSGEQLDRGRVALKRLAPVQPMLVAEHAPLLQGQEEKPFKQSFSDREAYLFGAQTLLVGADSAKLSEHFPQGFTFAQARQLFDTWLAQEGDSYTEQAIQAMWIGFAHRTCDLYYENEPEA